MAQRLTIRYRISIIICLISTIETIHFH